MDNILVDKLSFMYFLITLINCIFFAYGNDIIKLENYLNNISSFSGAFVQTNPDGTKTNGILKLKRDKNGGKLRIDSSNKTSIIANNKNFILYNFEDDSSECFDTSQIPAGFILQKKITLAKFNPKCSIKQNILYLSMEHNGSDITFYFSIYERTRNVKSLIGWSIIDMRSNLTELIFENKSVKINDQSCLINNNIFDINNIKNNIAN